MKKLFLYNGSKNNLYEYNTKNKRTRCDNMEILKCIMLLFILIFASMLGKIISKRYVYRLQELCDMKNALNILKNKIKFTYEPLSEIFEYISKNSIKNISTIFNKSINKMKLQTASEAWEEAVEETECNLKEEDKNVIKMLSKLLGMTDVEGQVSQIEITENFLNNQIQKAELEKQKNENLYKKLGMTVGAAIVIILI